MRRRLPKTGARARRRSERGAVTAELAMALPLLMAVTIGLVWLLTLGLAQARVVDAARETARALARGDDQGAAIAAGRRVAPTGAQVTVSFEGEHVVVAVAAAVTGPGGLFDVLPDARVDAEAVAALEQPSGGR